MKTRFLYCIPLFAAMLLLAASCAKTAAPETDNPYTRQMTVGSATLSVQVVSSGDDMAKGLSGRGQLDGSQGMLFDFGAGHAVYPSFWMKDMKFDLDLIWIRDNAVVGITPNVPAPRQSSGQLPLYHPPQPIDRVLEVNAGWAASHHIAAGTPAALSD